MQGDRPYLATHNQSLLSKKTANSHCTGLTIPEVVVSMLVIGFAVIGTVNLRYHATVDSERAESGMAASRLALMVAETWRGVQGSETFDAVTSLGNDLTIVVENNGPGEPNGFTLLGQYRVELNVVNYYTTLSYLDINADLRALNVTVSWEQRGIEDMEFADADKSFALTVYAER